jgi:SulP family sulfate permease
VVLASSFAALIFGGRGSVHLPEAIGYSLFGAIAVMTLIAILSSLPEMVGSLQDSTAAILALLAASVTTELSLELGYTVEQVSALSSTFLTVVTAVIVASTLTRLAFLVLGSFRLGNLVRYVPYSGDRRLPGRNRMAPVQGREAFMIGPQGRKGRASCVRRG